MYDSLAKRILIAPLDWGLGHTTRCIPIIRRLLDDKREVIFAGNDVQQTFVKSYFPNISYRFLQGYNVSYSRSTLAWTLLRQLPGLVRKINDEHEWLLRLAAAESIEGIISDNRYGLWHPDIPCVILTHQAAVRTGLGKLADTILGRIHYKFLSRFGECWLVDIEGKENIGGALSHPATLPANSHYIGWLSQLQKPSVTIPETHILILLSGPEPQRSILSDLLWKQAGMLQTRIVFVEGRADANRTEIPGHIDHYTRIADHKLQILLEGASMVICRSGYSTLMDLVLLKKKAVLIPTPGQTEQEYLAGILSKRGMFYSAPQKHFSLAAALEAVKAYPFDLPEIPNSHEQFGEILGEWVEELRG